MIDFTNSKEVICDYSGSEKKKKIIYNNNYYLLKFPDPIIKKDKKISYINNVFSEYIGSKIFKELKIPVQEVIIGKYKEPDTSTTLIKEKTVVACKDFTNNDKKLIEFSKLMNSVTTSDKKFKTDIKDIYEVINNLNLNIKRKEIIDNFWNMFVVDTLIGNVDRHLSNWGVIEENENIYFSNVYDCGSSLHPLLSDEEMQEIIKNKTKFKETVFSIYPIYKYDNKKLTYNEFYNKNIEDLNNSLLRIYPRINMENINKIIDKTPMSEIRKQFLKKSILFRKENILDKAYNKLLKWEI